MLGVRDAQCGRDLGLPSDDTCRLTHYVVLVLVVGQQTSTSYLAIEQTGHSLIIKSTVLMHITFIDRNICRGVGNQTALSDKS